MNYIFRELILPFLPSALTIIGWWIVGKRDNKSKKNAIHNKRVELASKLMDKILVDAKNFYALPGSTVESKNMSHLIASDFRKLSSMVNLISEGLDKSKKTSLAVGFIEYKKSVTGGEFGTISRLPIPTSNQLYIDIDMTYHDLYIELEKSYLI